MSIGYDYQAEAKAAMEMAATSISESERLKWVRVALAWQNLAHDHVESSGDAPFHSPSPGCPNSADSARPF